MEYRFLNQPGALSADRGSEWTESNVASLLLEDWRPPSARGASWNETKTIELKDQHIPTPLLETVPESVARENFVFPISDDGETLTVACVDEDAIAVADKLTFILARRIEMVRADRSDIEEAIARHYGPPRTELVDSMLTEYTETAIDFDDFEMAGEPASHPASLEKADAYSRSRPRHLGYDGDTFDSEMLGALPDRKPEGVTAMFVHTVEDGERVLMTRRDGTKELIVGPQRIWGWRNRFVRLRHSVAHPGQFLMVRYRDGSQEHLQGPAETWFDPRIHEEISCAECLQISSKEAVVVYSRQESDEATPISRRILYGPALFVPQPGEWLHQFSWHASKGGHQGVEKQPNGLVFQKLWLMPDQMYHDVRDVRTADNAVLTIRLMIFFELTDIERMLEATHDPIGDFVNAATADVIGFTGKHEFESFKQNTDQLNDLATYKTLSSRSQQIGYRINNVVYRGYGAADSLQKMHDQAIEGRTRLQLDRATEEQTQELENYRLESQLSRSAKRRSEQTDEVRHELELNREKQEAELQQQQTRQDFLRDQRGADARLQEEILIREYEMQTSHMSALREMNVDLTAYLTQARADQVIEFRGGTRAPHIHLDPSQPTGNGRSRQPNGSGQSHD
jgi:hypothetical protein